VTLYRGIAIRILQLALIAILAGAGWRIYQRLPSSPPDDKGVNGTTTLQILMERPSGTEPKGLDVIVELYPVDMVAVRDEFFTEPRAGKRFLDFLKERMKGRSPVTMHLDKQGRGSIALAPGNWWLHAKLVGEEELEWRLPVSVNGPKQTLQLNAENAYTRSKTF
jgi:hypothetical protein